MWKFMWALLALLVVTACGDTHINNYYYQEEDTTGASSDTSSSLDATTTIDTLIAEVGGDVLILVTSPCDEVACEQGSLCVELDGEATCQPVQTCNYNKDCLGRGLCMENSVWQSTGSCIEGFCEMQELRGCNESCDEFTLYDNSVGVACGEDHRCTFDSDCDDNDPCTDNLCMFTPHIGSLACNFAYKGEAALCQNEQGDPGRCYDSICQTAVGQMTFQDNPSQSDVMQDNTSCVASFIVKMDNVESGRLREVSFLNQVGGDVVSAQYSFLLYVDGIFVESSTAVAEENPNTGYYQGDRLIFENLDINLIRGGSRTVCLRFYASEIPSVLFGYYWHFVLRGGWAMGMTTGAPIIGVNDTLGKKVQIGSY